MRINNRITLPLKSHTALGHSINLSHLPRYTDFLLQNYPLMVQLSTETEKEGRERIHGEIESSQSDQPGVGP